MQWPITFGRPAPNAVRHRTSPKAQEHPVHPGTAASAKTGAHVGSTVVPHAKVGGTRVEALDPKTSQALQPLFHHNHLKVKQGMELSEFLLALESPNGYAVTDEKGKPLYAVKEKMGGPIRWFERWFLRQARPFTIEVLDQSKQRVMTFKRPIRPVFSRMEVFGPDNQLVGTLQRRFKFFGERYELRCPDGHLLAVASAWTIGPRHFSVRAGGQRVGDIRKRFAGIFHEGWSKADKYEVTWDQKKMDKARLSASSQEQLRALGFATLFLVDYDAFDA